ncbi:MAG: FAD binding domain-containing protein [Spirochaetota bacterium]
MIRPFAYVKPQTIVDALSALDGENARVLAGGTDLLVDMRNGMVRPDLLVDIKRIGDLKLFSFDSGGVTIGSCVTLNEIVDNADLRRVYPVLCDAASSIATYQLRNRATAIGNICNASPAADMLPPLFILDAMVVINSREGERKVAIRDFVTGVKQTSLKRGEIVVRVEVPAPPAEARMLFLKKQRIRGHDLAIINIAGLAHPGSGTLRLCIGACGETPLIVPGTDELYRAMKDPGKLSEEVSELALRAISPIDDVRASAEYRRDMVGVYVRRLVEQLCA